MTRGQRMAHQKIWLALTAFALLLAAFALYRRGVVPAQDPPPALRAEASP